MTQATTGRFTGTSVRRADAPEALRGEGRYTADVDFPDMLYAAVYRSPYAHARVVKVDLTRALAVPGVVAGLTGATLPSYVRPLVRVTVPRKWTDDGPGTAAVNPRSREVVHDCLARERVRYVGEPVAILVADDPYVAEDALELVDAEFESLPVVADPVKGLEPGAPRLFDTWDDNVVLRYVVEGGDIEAAFKTARHVVRVDLRSSRFTGTPIEPRVVVARYQPVPRVLEVWDATQGAHLVENWISAALDLPGVDVRVSVPRLGGGFGPKASVYAEEVLVALLAYQTGRPVRWVETRSEHMVGTAHARDQLHEVEVAVDEDGVILGLRDRIIADVGAGYDPSGLSAVLVTAWFVPGAYRIKNYACELLGVVTNKTPYGAHRGFGKAEAAYVIERVMDVVARRLKMDRLEIRRRNFIRPEEFPYECATGSRYDSGRYEEALDLALARLDHPYWKAEQARLRRQGRWIGIGFATVIEPSATHRRGTAGYFSVRMQMLFNGKVRVYSSGNDDGTGHGTVIGQLVADELGMTPEEVFTLEGDSLLCPFGTGSFASRFSVTGASAVTLAARALRNKIVQIAAALLATDAARLTLQGGHVLVDGKPERRVALKEIARVAYMSIHQLPAGFEPGLEVLYSYRDPNVDVKMDARGRIASFGSFPYASDAAVVEVDPGSGKIEILKYVSVHDCGNMMNPKEVAGQHLGALVHGIGGAIYEEIVYDENSQPLVQNFKDYLVPTAVEAPHFVLDHLVTPNPFTPGGFKGAGETGTVSVPPCLASAVEDALEPLGVEVLTLPLKPETIWRHLRSRRAT